MPRRRSPCLPNPRPALKILFVEHDILNPEAWTRRAPPPNCHAVWMEKVSATCNGAVLESPACMPDRAGWVESKAVQCRSVSKKPAALLTTVAALTSNHGYIAWGKPRLCPVFLFLTLCLSLSCRQRFCVKASIHIVAEVSLLPLLTKGLPGDPQLCSNESTPALSQGCGYFACFRQCLRNSGGSSAVRSHSWWREQDCFSAWDNNISKLILQQKAATAGKAPYKEMELCLWTQQSGQWRRCSWSEKAREVWAVCSAADSGAGLSAAPHMLHQPRWDELLEQATHTDTTRGQIGQDPLWESPHVKEFASYITMATKEN